MNEHTNLLPLTDYQLSVNAKMADIHRQALIKKLSRIGDNETERQNTLDEIQACSEISQAARLLDDKRLRQVIG
ncbi:MAG TPA: hypothetical protein VEV86_10925 [Vicinamibacterales bacterium]|nr:hypothetical protein [Vicinamibacterales bacterium]